MIELLLDKLIAYHRTLEATFLKSTAIGPVTLMHFILFEIFHHDVANGRLYAYRVLRPERATLSIGRAPSGAWRIRDLKLFMNATASRVTLDVARKWLGRHNTSL